MYRQSKSSNIQYPNPAYSTLFFDIEGDSTTKTRARIYNMTGRLIIEKEIVDGNSISLSKLDKGIYIIELSNDSFHGMSQFVKF